MTLPSWSRRRSPPPPAPAPGDRADEAGELVPAFVCTTCGRADLPEAGGWDPPICLECDAAINEDALWEAGAYDDV